MGGGVTSGMRRSLKESSGYKATEMIQMRKMEQNTRVCDAWQILPHLQLGGEENLPFPPITLIIQPREKLDKSWWCLDTAIWWITTQVQGLRHVTTAALSPVHAQGEGRPQCLMKPRQEGAKFAFWAFCSRKWDYKEQNAIDATKPNRQGVHPTATISHDFSGRDSLKFL